MVSNSKAMTMSKSTIAECNGKCKPTIMEYDKNCLLHGWIDEADEVLYKNLRQVDPCYDRNDRLTDKAKMGIYNAMKEHTEQKISLLQQEIEKLKELITTTKQ
jgi:hypothetical protein